MGAGRDREEGVVRAVGKCGRECVAVAVKGEVGDELAYLLGFGGVRCAIARIGVEGNDLVGGSFAGSREDSSYCLGKCAVGVWAEEYNALMMVNLLKKLDGQGGHTSFISSETRIVMFLWKRPWARR